MIDIAQTGAATSGRLCWSMRLHPHRQHEFAVLPKKNSDPSPFGIYPLAPLDLIARPEDCAGKVLTNRPDSGDVPPAIAALMPVKNQSPGRPFRLPASFLSGFPELHSALDRDLADIGAIALAKSVSTVYQEQHLLSRSRFRKTALTQ